MIRLATLFVLLLAGSLTAEEPPLDLVAREKAVREGTHVLRRILFDEGFTALASLDDLSETPQQALLVMLGNLETLHRVPGGLRRFVEQGGAVLLASDRPVRDRDAAAALIDLAGVSISGNHLITPNFWECYQNREYCPFLLPASGARINLFVDLDGQPLRPIATNVPAQLLTRRFNPPLGVLAVLTNSAQQETADGLRPVNAWPVLVRGGPLGDGRAVVLADHSLFINEMMMPQDTGNVEFAVNLVRYLGEGKRNKVLFLEEGKVQTRLDLPLQSPHLKLDELLTLLYSRKDTLLQEAERWIAKQEDDNAFNRWLVDFLDRRFGWYPLLFGLACVATFVVLLYALFRLGVWSRYGPDRSTPLLIHAAAKLLPQKPLVEQRLEALLRQGDLREPLRVLTRHWLSNLGLSPPRFPREPLPALEANSWWASWHYHGRVQRIWQLAGGQWPSRIPPGKLQEWQRELDALQQAHKAGHWRARGTG
ncbi:MAG: DUF4350 domain-containing protein [Gemmataceae bacterium]